MINVYKNQTDMFVLGKSKDLIIKSLEKDSNIVSIILGEGSSVTVLKDINVFDSLVIDLTQNEAKTYITMDATVSSIENKKIKSVDITLDIFTHLSCTKLTTSEQGKYYSFGLYGNRIDCLVDLVTRLLLDNETIGVTQLKFKERNPMTIVQPNTNYYGKRLYFTATDL